MSRSKVISKFERLLFKGVPEQAENVYQRDDHSYPQKRKRGMSQTSADFDVDSLSEESLGYLKYDLKKGEIEYVTTL